MDPIDQKISDLPKTLATAGANEKQVVADSRKTEAVGLSVTGLNMIQPQPIEWLVPDYLPLGKTMTIAGDGGEGKSTITCDLAANISQGLPCFGLQYNPPQPADVLFISCEDDFGDTVVPRLLSAGADLNRIAKVDGIRTKDGKIGQFNLAHYEQLEAELVKRPNVRLVIIDPVTAYVGKARIDDHRDSELRSVLDPLAQLAAARKVTILLIIHFNKGAAIKAVNRVMGGAGYVNAVRAAYGVMPDPEDETQKLLLPLKFNCGPWPSGLAFQMASLASDEQERILTPFTNLQAEDRSRLGHQLFRIRWLGESKANANDVFATAARRDRQPGKVDDCASWLEQFLAKHAYPSDEVFAAAESAGFNRKNCYTAKRNLGIKASNRGSFAGIWHWGIGEPSKWTTRPKDHTYPSTAHTGNNGKYANNANNGDGLNKSETPISPEDSHTFPSVLPFSPGNSHSCHSSPTCPSGAPRESMTDDFYGDIPELDGCRPEPPVKDGDE